jgi:hypothetical protein
MSTAKERTVYHIGPLRLWLAPAFFILLAGLLLLLAVTTPDDPKSGRALVLTALFLCACAALLHLLLRYTRLVISERGVRLYQIGYTLETDWGNVARLSEQTGARGLVLHRPMQCRGASVLRAFRRVGTPAGARFYGDEQVRLLAERRLIPLDAFAYRLKHGRLREELERRAPSLAARPA